MASEQEDERERLIQMFHDLVDEALVQYADGFAVDLEHSYHELADQLIAEREQQLTEAREEIVLLTDQLRFSSEALERLQHTRDGYMEQAVGCRMILKHLAHLDQIPNGEALLTARVLGEQAREVLAKMESSDGK